MHTWFLRHLPATAGSLYCKRILIISSRITLIIRGDLKPIIIAPKKYSLDSAFSIPKTHPPHPPHQILQPALHPTSPFTPTSTAYPTLIHHHHHHPLPNPTRPQKRPRHLSARFILPAAFAPYVFCVAEVREDLWGLVWVSMLTGTGGRRKGGFTVSGLVSGSDWGWSSEWVWE